ncbi:xanthine dehydrogenase family protein molybdopterin-binding subunit [Sneathiella limimaris]|uniref:xanthine dehydrogenase family protein molybdopterin-binding subunit n=1 Tax=Sneathiella limimaris TaxID=1964213 RepID=UPI00146ADFFD|nr:molybdopterin cofactor-binding domain-containing protein [Sneathiella limimaris]
MNRRNFLKIGSSALFVSVGGCSLIPPIPKRPNADAEAALGWLSYDKGKYEFYLPRVEMGQGVEIGLMQIAATELHIPLEDLNLHYQNTRQMKLVKATVGSVSIKEYAYPLALAAASLKKAIDKGIDGQEIEVEMLPASSLMSLKGEGYVGKAISSPLVEDIVTGRPLYAADVQIEGLIYGRVLRAPASLETKTKPVSIDDRLIKNIPGYLGYVEDERLQYGQSIGLGILASTPSKLDEIEDKIDVEWETESLKNYASIQDRLIDEQLLTQQDPTYSLTDNLFQKATETQLDLTFSIPAASHNSIEPRASVAAPNKTGMKIWCGSQDVFYVRDVVCRHLDLDPENVEVQGMRVGGAFGSRTIASVELEAAILANHVNRPVKVQWTRKQELKQGFLRPPLKARVRANLANTSIKSWDHHVSSSHILFTNAALPHWMQALTDLFVGDKGVARGLIPAYELPMAAIGYDLTRLPIHTGPWRGLGAAPNNLVIESTIDELAYIAGADPIEFRLHHLKNARLKNVLKRAHQIAQSNPPHDKTPGFGQGVAIGVYKDMSYVAVIADVIVSASGDVEVKRLICAQDCGLIINPDRVKSQIEGNLMWGLSLALLDQHPITNGQISSESFADIEIPALYHTPEFEIALINSTEAPTGAGETAIVAAGPAICNAIRAATGCRPTRFPINKDELKLKPTR